MTEPDINNPAPPAPKFSGVRLMIKLDRVAALVLLVVIIAYGLTGYAMTKGLLDRELARSLHLGWLGAIGLIAFVIHTSWALHLACKRRAIWNSFTKAALIIFYTVVFSFFIYLHFFYSPAEPARTADTNTAAGPAIIAPDMVFTATSLAVYDGRGGQPAYAAVDGLVYDFSLAFRNGGHYGHTAGQDLSSAFHAQHPADYLKRYPVVGTYQAN